MDTIGGLLRLVYFREWRFTRRNSRALYDAAIWVVTRIEIWAERLRRYIREQIKNRRKTQHTPPDEDQMRGPGDA